MEGLFKAPNSERRKRIISLISVLLLILPCFFSGPAWAQENRLGVVTSGAFLLTGEPDVESAGLMVHGLDAYLPIGTVLSVSGRRSINNRRERKDETYYEVDTDIGLSGLVREDRFVFAGNRPLLVPVAPYQLELYPRTATSLDKGKAILFSRNDDVHLEITDESTPDYYDVILFRHKPPSGLPRTEEFRMKKELVEMKEVKLIRPSQYGHYDFPGWSGLKPLNKDMISALIEKVRTKFPEKIREIERFLSDLPEIQCILSSEARAKLGFEIFGTGLEFNLDLSILKEDTMYTFETCTLKVGNQIRTFIMLRNIRCENGKAERMRSFTLQEGVFNPERRYFVRLEDIASTPSPWIKTLRSPAISRRMILVDGWEAYQQTYKILDTLADSGQADMSRLPYNERALLINFIIGQISFFEWREKLISR